MDETMPRFESMLNHEGKIGEGLVSMDIKGKGYVMTNRKIC